MSIMKDGTWAFVSLFNLFVPCFTSLNYLQTLESSMPGSPHKPFNQNL